MPRRCWSVVLLTAESGPGDRDTPRPLVTCATDTTGSAQRAPQTNTTLWSLALYSLCHPARPVNEDTSHQFIRLSGSWLFWVTTALSLKTLDQLCQDYVRDPNTAFGSRSWARYHQPTSLVTPSSNQLPQTSLLSETERFSWLIPAASFLIAV